MTEFMLSDESWRRRVRGACVLELGCGLALPGLVAHLLGACTALLTDRRVHTPGYVLQTSACEGAQTVLLTTNTLCQPLLPKGHCFHDFPVTHRLQETFSCHTRDAGNMLLLHTGCRKHAPVTHGLQEGHRGYGHRGRGRERTARRSGLGV